MHLKDLLQKETVWYKRAFFVNTYHSIKLMSNDKWTQKDTARDLEISIGMVSEDMTLVLGIRKNADLTQLSRNCALRQIKAKGKL